jgi:Glycosyl hydrolase catalytic core
MCKRGVAWDLDTLADASLLSKGVRWWWNWSVTPQAAVSGGFASVGMEFVPMVWNGTDVGNGKAIPSSSALLGFNEPDNAGQANMTAQSAASLWPQVESMAKAASISKLVSPAVASSITWMDQFMSLCSGCQIDYIAFHDYTDTAAALEAEVQEFEKYNKPIWLTEFACNHNATNTPCSLSEQEAFMNAVIPWLESQSQIARYAWFSGSNVPNSVLIQNGQLTALGQLYVGLPGTCS